MEFVEEVYKVTAGFPKSETYGLTGQIRRAAVSVPSNIAEGHARKSTKDFPHHLSFAIGSASELETQLLLAARLGYLTDDRGKELAGQSAELARLINCITNSLARKLAPAQPNSK